MNDFWHTGRGVPGGADVVRMRVAAIAALCRHRIRAADARLGRPGSPLSCVCDFFEIEEHDGDVVFAAVLVG